MSKHKNILNAFNTEIIEFQKKLQVFIDSDELTSANNKAIVELLNSAIRSLDHTVEKFSEE